jgi:hypothetical protein
MSNLMWKNDAELLEILREEKRVCDAATDMVEQLELQIKQHQHLINTSGTRSIWAHKYLMHDLTGTRWENNVEGWHAQRDRNQPITQGCTK